MYWIRRKFRRLFRSMGRFFGGLFRLLMSPFRFVGWLARGSMQGISRWYRSRRWRNFVWGLPALLIFATAGYFVLTTAFVSKTKLRLRYVKAGQAASVSEDWDAATLYLERAVELGVRDPDAMFELAVAADRSDDMGRRDAILEKLAPDGRPVHAPSHLWKTAQLLGVNPLPNENVEKAEQQLRYALTVDPDNVNAHGILGDLYFQRGYLDGAVFHLGKASRSLAHYQLLHAKACVLTGKTAEAEASANQVRSITSQKLGFDPKDEPSRIELGEALFILEDFREAAEILKLGLRESKNPQALQHALARTYLGWADSILKRQGNTGKGREDAFRLVAAAMSQNPDDAIIFNRMLQLVSIEDQASKRARAFLLDNIATGRAVGLSHLLLGTNFHQLAEYEKAGYHLKQAFRMLPTAPIVANNLAWHLVRQDPPQVDPAMRLIEEVLERYPNNAAFVDTRANVYLRQGEWEKAIEDFQVSLGQFPGVSSIHSGLREAYAGLGMTELAERHGLIADHLRLTEQADAAAAKFELSESVDDDSQLGSDD